MAVAHSVMAVEHIRFSGKTIKTYIDGELYGTYYVKSLNGNSAELSLTMGASSMEIRAVRR